MKLPNQSKAITRNISGSSIDYGAAHSSIFSTFNLSEKKIVPQGCTYVPYPCPVGGNWGVCLRLECTF